MLLRLPGVAYLHVVGFFSTMVNALRAMWASGWNCCSYDELIVVIGDPTLGPHAHEMFHCENLICIICEHNLLTNPAGNPLLLP